MFSDPSNYDIIIDRDFLSKIGLKVDFDQKQMIWLEVGMKEPGYWKDELNTVEILKAQNDVEES